MKFNKKIAILSIGVTVIFSSLFFQNCGKNTSSNQSNNTKSESALMPGTCLFKIVSNAVGGTYCTDPLALDEEPKNCPQDSICPGTMGVAIACHGTTGDYSTAGFYAKSPSDQSCTKCEPGFYCENGLKQACDSGLTSSEGALNVSSCTTIPTHTCAGQLAALPNAGGGQYCDGEVLKTCDPGYYCNPTEDIKHTQCQIPSSLILKGVKTVEWSPNMISKIYKESCDDLKNVSKILTCDTGNNFVDPSSNPQDVNTSANLTCFCKSGYFLDDKSGRCEQCQIGSYCVGNNIAVTCSDAKTTTGLGAKSETECTTPVNTCSSASSKYCDAAGIQQTCPAGFYCDGTTVSPVKCQVPTDLVKLGAAGVSWKDTMSGATSVADCKIENVNSINSCKDGYSAPDSSSSLFCVCPAGNHITTDASGNKTCSPCSENMYCSSTTKSTDTDALINASMVACDSGTSTHGQTGVQSKDGCTTIATNNSSTSTSTSTSTGTAATTTTSTCEAPVGKYCDNNKILDCSPGNYCLGGLNAIENNCDTKNLLPAELVKLGAKSVIWSDKMVMASSIDACTNMNNVTQIKRCTSEVSDHFSVDPSYPYGRCFCKIGTYLDNTTNPLQPKCVECPVIDTGKSTNYFCDGSNEKIECNFPNVVSKDKTACIDTPIIKYTDNQDGKITVVANDNIKIAVNSSGAQVDHYTMTGCLPDGLKFDIQSGSFTGSITNPTDNNNCTATIKAQTSTGKTDTKTITIVISDKSNGNSTTTTTSTTISTGTNSATDTLGTSIGQSGVITSQTDVNAKMSDIKISCTNKDTNDVINSTNPNVTEGYGISCLVQDVKSNATLKSVDFKSAEWEILDGSKTSVSKITKCKSTSNCSFLARELKSNLNEKGEVKSTITFSGIFKNDATKKIHTAIYDVSIKRLTVKCKLPTSTNNALLKDAGSAIENAYPTEFEKDLICTSSEKKVTWMESNQLFNSCNNLTLKNGKNSNIKCSVGSKFAYDSKKVHEVKVTKLGISSSGNPVTYSSDPFYIASPSKPIIKISCDGKYQPQLDNNNDGSTLEKPRKLINNIGDINCTVIGANDPSKINWTVKPSISGFNCKATIGCKLTGSILKLMKVNQVYTIEALHLNHVSDIFSKYYLSVNESTTVGANNTSLTVADPKTTSTSLCNAYKDFYIPITENTAGLCVKGKIVAKSLKQTLPVKNGATVTSWSWECSDGSKKENCGEKQINTCLANNACTLNSQIPCPAKQSSAAGSGKCN